LSFRTCFGILLREKEILNQVQDDSKIPIVIPNLFRNLVKRKRDPETSSG